jgi:nitrile hydratase
MNGAQDLGGMMGFGPVVAERNEPVFHAEWEKRALGITLCCGALGAWNIDVSRHARETLHPADYLSSSYYEIWIKGLLKLLAANGLVRREELAAGRSLDAPKATKQMLKAADVPARLARGGPCDRPLDRAPRFQAGDRVRTRNIHPTTHTRLPRYARGRTGVVTADRGIYVFPDTSANNQGEKPQHLYSVRFEARELWGAQAKPKDTVYIDMWDDYLERI